MSRKKHPRQSWLINFHGKFLKKKSSIFNTYLEVRNQHARFLNTVVILVDIIVILIFLKAAYIVARNLGVIEKISEFEHIDILAIFFGALGIIMAFLITIYVEGNHDKEHRSLKSATKLIIDTTSDLTSKATEITSTTHDIFTQTNKILAKFNSLEQLKDLSERLSAFEEILTITEDSQKLDEKFHNELYILNYNASYGHLQSFNANITIKETQHKKGVNSWSEYHREIHKYYVDREIKNFFRLSTLKKETVHFALLRTNEHDRENHEDRYEKLLKKVLLEGKDHKVIAYSEFDTDPDNFILLDQLNEKSDRDVYTLELPEVNPKEYTPGGATDQKHLKGSLIKKLLEDNRNKLNSIKNQNIAFLDYIPFQFFLTAPKGPNLGSRQKCLIIFTNILSIEEHKTNTVSFTSDNAELIQSLKDIHVTLTNEYLINKAQSENL